MMSIEERQVVSFFETSLGKGVRWVVLVPAIPISFILILFIANLVAYVMLWVAEFIFPCFMFSFFYYGIAGFATGLFVITIASAIAPDHKKNVAIVVTTLIVAAVGLYLIMVFSLATTREIPGVSLLRLDYWVWVVQQLGTIVGSICFFFRDE